MRRSDPDTPSRPRIGASRASALACVALPAAITAATRASAWDWAALPAAMTARQSASAFAWALGGLQNCGAVGVCLGLCILGISIHRCSVGGFLRGDLGLVGLDGGDIIAVGICKNRYSEADTMHREIRIASSFFIVRTSSKM